MIHGCSPKIRSVAGTAELDRREHEIETVMLCPRATILFKSTEVKAPMPKGFLSEVGAFVAQCRVYAERLLFRVWRNSIASLRFRGRIARPDPIGQPESRAGASMNSGKDFQLSVYPSQLGIRLGNLSDGQTPLTTAMSPYWQYSAGSRSSRNRLRPRA